MPKSTRYAEYSIPTNSVYFPLYILNIVNLQHVPCHDRQVSQNAPESISECLKFKKFPGGRGHALADVCAHALAGLLN